MIDTIAAITNEADNIWLDIYRLSNRVRSLDEVNKLADGYLREAMNDLTNFLDELGAK